MNRSLLMLSLVVKSEVKSDVKEWKIPEVGLPAVLFWSGMCRKRKRMDGMRWVCLLMDHGTHTHTHTHIHISKPDLISSQFWIIMCDRF